MLISMVDLASAAVRAPQAVQLIDFENVELASRITFSPGVTGAIVPDPQRKGARVLEVHVEPFEKHRNLYPSLAFDDKVFARPRNLSGYSRLETKVTNPNSRSSLIHFYVATVPHNDGGRNLDETLTTIPPNTEASPGFSLDALERNDPSALQMAMFVFPVVDVPAVYRIRSLSATLTEKQGSPAAKLRTEIGGLKSRFELLQKRSGQGRGAEYKKLSQTIAAALRQLEPQAALVDTPEGTGKLAALQQQTGELAGDIGLLPFADEREYFLWNVEPYHNFGRAERPGPDSQMLQSLQLSMARNEYRSLPFMVSPGHATARLSFEIVCQGLPKQALYLKETGYLPNRSDTQTGDILLPLHGALVVPKGESRQLRLCFDTQAYGVRPGRYPFKLNVKDIDTGKRRSIDGVLQVWNFELPQWDVLPFNSYAQFGTSEFQSEKALSNAVRDMKKFGMNIVFIHPSELPRPLGLDGSDKITGYDESSLITSVSRIQRAWDAAPGTGKLRFLVSLSGAYDMKPAAEGIEVLSPRWKPVFAQWLNHLHSSLRGAGLKDTDWMMTMGDEANEAVLANREIPVAEAVKEAIPGVKLVCNTSIVPADGAMSKRFFDVFDIFQPDLVYGINSNPWLLNSLQKNAAKRGKQVWTYKCVGDMAMTGKNVYGYYRAYAWEALQKGLTGMGLWTYCSQAEAQAKMSYVLVYNREDEVAHARRYEVLTESMNDYRYVFLLRQLAAQRGPKELKRANQMIEKAARDIMDHPDDTTRCDKWRLAIAREISVAYKAASGK